MASASAPMDELKELKEFIARMKAQTSRSHAESDNSVPSQEQKADSSHGTLTSKPQTDLTPHNQETSPHAGGEHSGQDGRLNLTTPSPARQGVMAPHNTPLMTTTNPDAIAVAEEEATPSSHEVGDAIADYLKGMEGKPLAESMWAPKSVTQRRSFAKGPRTDNYSPNPSKNLTTTWESHLPVKTVEPKPEVTRLPHLKARAGDAQKENQNPTSTKTVDTTPERLVPVKVVEPNPEINDQFTPMSFKAADSRSERSMVDAFTQTDTVYSKSDVTDFATHADAHNTRDRKSPSVNPPHKKSLLSTSDAAQEVDRHVRMISPSTPPAASGAASDSSSTPTQTSSAKKAMTATKATAERDIKPEQPDLPLEFLKRWAHNNKAALTGAAQSNGGGSPVPGRSAPAVRSGSANAKPADEKEDRRSMQYFSSWGTQEKRDRPPAEVRTALLKPLPPNATLAFIANLVYGGPLEKIRIHVGGKGASVTFLNPADCKRFYDDTANGLVYSTSPPTGPVRRYKHLEVELSDVAEPLVGKLYEYAQKGLTRCVKAVPVDDGFTMPYLQKLAADKNRSVVAVQEGRGIANARYIIFHFGNIEHAVQFRASLARDDDFEQCNLSFAKDPCAEATGPRTGPASS